MSFLACNLTILSVVVVMDERLNFTSLAVAGALKQIKAFVLDHMTALVHVTDLQCESFNIVENILRILQKKVVSPANRRVDSCRWSCQKLWRHSDKQMLDMWMSLLWCIQSRSHQSSGLSTSLVRLTRKVVSDRPNEGNILREERRKKRISNKSHTDRIICSKSENCMIYVSMCLYDHLDVRMLAFHDSAPSALFCKQQCHPTWHRYRNLYRARCQHMNQASWTSDRTANSCWTMDPSSGNWTLNTWTSPRCSTSFRTLWRFGRSWRSARLPCADGNLRWF